MLLRLRKERARQSILEGVYRQNRRVFGNEPLIARRGYSRLLKRIPLFALLALVLFFGNTGLLNSTQHSVYDDVANGPGSILKFGAPSAFPPVSSSSVGFGNTGAPPVLQGAKNGAPGLAVPGEVTVDTEGKAFRNQHDTGRWGGAEGPGSLQRTGGNQRNEFVDGHTPGLRQIFGLGVRTIVVDPGHGGSDPGTAGKMGLREKDIALDVAKRLRERLERYARYKVVLTREDDVTLPLNKRIEFANELRADLFISVHVNYLPSRPNNLIETYYYGVSDDESILELALLENAQSMVGINEFTDMVEKLGGTLKFQESKRLASEIQRSLFTNISRDDSTVIDMGIKKAPFLVIMGTEMPGVLAEVTCLSNEEEELKLRTPAYREDIAGYLELGIINYLNKGDYVYEARRR